MSWHPVNPASGRRLMEKLMENEWCHVALTAELRESSPSPRFGQAAGGRLWVLGEKNTVRGGLYFSHRGVCLPAYEPDDLDEGEREFLWRVMISRREHLFSVMGRRDRVDLIETLLRETPRKTADYRLMTDENSVPAEKIPPGMKIKKAGIADLEKLWPLEQGYHEEEVLQGSGGMNERVVRRHFSANLKSQLIYYAEIDGHPVAKVGTNARGWTYDQIGGVYTTPTLRSRGLSRILMNHLLATIRSQGKRTCLFVRIINPAALRLYENLGFRDRCPFRITYWS